MPHTAAYETQLASTFEFGAPFRQESLDIFETSCWMCCLPGFHECSHHTELSPAMWKYVQLTWANLPQAARNWTDGSKLLRERIYQLNRTKPIQQIQHNRKSRLIMLRPFQTCPTKNIPKTTARFLTCTWFLQEIGRWECPRRALTCQVRGGFENSPLSWCRLQKTHYCEVEMLCLHESEKNMCVFVAWDPAFLWLQWCTHTIIVLTMQNYGVVKTNACARSQSPHTFNWFHLELLVFKGAKFIHKSLPSWLLPSNLWFYFSRHQSAQTKRAFHLAKLNHLWGPIIWTHPLCPWLEYDNQRTKKQTSKQTKNKQTSKQASKQTSFNLIHHHRHVLSHFQSQLGIQQMSCAKVIRGKFLPVSHHQWSHATNR